VETVFLDIETYNSGRVEYELAYSTLPEL